MNAPFPPPAKTAEYDESLADACAWRGRFVQQFAEMELLVGECLQALATAKRTGTRVKTGQPFRQAVEELARVTAVSGSFAKQGRGITISIRALARLLDWRAHLTHGSLDVWRGRRGQWLLTLRYRETDNQGPIRWHAIPVADATAMVDEFAAEVQKFEQRTAALKRTLSGASA
jgi:predicted dehydrogenase